MSMILYLLCMYCFLFFVFTPVLLEFRCSVAYPSYHTRCEERTKFSHGAFTEISHSFVPLYSIFPFYFSSTALMNIFVVTLVVNQLSDYHLLQYVRHLCRSVF
ncbi:hypothetical protein, unlikely [Trypanosoma brucei gambiense DAL972]|uniref:Uncharacterized protein n=1 Tax=Trypanosoma brucei gambiense (strain MHOM/CI/86/DAL972) TaxID=679716 RepID=C9ZPJ1_TRYB9|nr:hypothetical protein, unlikely [Trypanosoma brucei gambiense DAL972]CBH11319.1 hypothetical protein, unlikely [Trypanosoma brucei gambiense DAL972]|eukprot:XP_011773606.1 hypothetical protein, unlikely [Trypanosoma brucei gambiense DAL972]